MIKFKLTTYREDKAYQGSYFFILNKGNNSGKPLLTPCPNCFVCLCENDQDKEELYWLLFGMWQGKAIHPHLIGSVIPFIRLKELTNLIHTGIEKLLSNPDKVKRNISKIAQMEKHQMNIQKQLNLIKQMKQALIFEVLQ
ncbi:MAG: DUF6943 family protein [Crocinitomicaceae bacterium]|jgi:hypothetical protein